MGAPTKLRRWRLSARAISLALLSGAVLASPGSASDGGHDVRADVEAAYGALPFDDPSDTVVLIFNHGSGPEFTPDRCKREKDVPQVIRKLDHRRLGGKQVIVYAYCTPSRVGEYRHESRTGEPKVVKRARDIEELVGDFMAAGFPSRNIFLIGHSAGAWASLLVARRRNVDFNSVIAFGPAFAGRKATRSQGWWDLHRKQSAYLRRAPGLNAMVFAFEGDTYSDISELGSTFGAPGTKFVTVTRAAGRNGDCRKVATHRGAFTKCFEDFAGQRISSFIEQRLRDAGSPGASADKRLSQIGWDR